MLFQKHLYVECDRQTNDDTVDQINDNEYLS